MELLKRGFAPKNNETVETYINLIYGENYEEEDDDDDNEMDDDIPTAGTRQHWQYAHRQFHQKMKSIHIKRQVRQIRNKNKEQSDNNELKNLLFKILKKLQLQILGIMKKMMMTTFFLS